MYFTRFTQELPVSIKMVSPSFTSSPADLQIFSFSSLWLIFLSENADSSTCFPAFSLAFTPPYTFLIFPRKSNSSISLRTVFLEIRYFSQSSSKLLSFCAKIYSSISSKRLSLILFLRLALSPLHFHHYTHSLYFFMHFLVNFKLPLDIYHRYANIILNIYPFFKNVYKGGVTWE